MSTVAEIEKAIQKLSPEDRLKLERRLLELKSKNKSIFQKLTLLAGTGHDLPADLGSNHDHYLHGTAKRTVK